MSIVKPWWKWYHRKRRRDVVPYGELIDGILGAKGVAAWRSDLGITLNGADVAQWDDQLENGNNLVQGTAANQPLFGVAGGSGPNNAPFVEFDGVSEFMDVAYTLTQPWTINMIVMPSVTDDTAGCYVDGKVFLGGALRVGAGAAWTWNGPDAGSHNDATPKDSWHKQLVLWSGAASSWTIGGGTPKVQDVGTRAPSGLTIGKFGGGQATHIDCRYADIIVANAALTAGEQAAIDAYFLSEYSL